ncbi:MAG: sugar phosphate isomerase/epimerase [Ferruginibacter sp.]|nr:sugar phosphate isomerase/epimerase [Ferruginibacter sp.]
MNARRNFIKQSALLSTGLAMNPSEFLKIQTKVGIQLYSLRDDIEKNVKSVISKVAAAGYKEVETYGLSKEGQFFGLSVSEFAQLLKANNLTSPSGHYLPEKMLFENGDGDDVKKLCEVGHTLGHRYIVIPHLEEDKRKTIDQYKALAARMNIAGKICRNAGLQLAYHNHDFEFLQINGQRGYDIFMNETDKDLVKLELDLYWVVSAGLDPIDFFKKQPGRFPMVHVKDMDKADRTKNTEIGNGSINFKRILASSAVAGIKHYYLEQENNYVPDTFTSIQKSYSYIRKNLLK